MRIARLLTVLATLAACGTPDDASDGRGSARDTLQDLRGAAITPTLGGACSAMSRVTRGTLRIAVGRDRSSTFAAPRPESGTWQGCRLIGNGSLPADASAPDALLRPALAVEGWKEDARYAATRAHASSFGVRRATVLCVLVTTTADVPAVTTPGAADATPTRSYRLEIRCTENPVDRD